MQGDPRWPPSRGGSGGPPTAANRDQQPSSGIDPRLTEEYGIDVTPDVDAPTVSTGTTIVGIRADEAVVLAADRRASLGGRFVSNKDAEKIEPVHPSAAVAQSGGVGAIQAFARQLRVEANLYEARRGEPMTMDALSTMAGDLVRGVPAQVILGGVTPPAASTDAGNPHLYELDGGGSVMETDYAAGGSGMQPAYGVLERDVEGRDLSVEEATSVAARAVQAASERDTASGNGLTLGVVGVTDVTTTTYDDPTEVR